jgi:pyridoxal phosphate enzyme (YggS family)
METIASRLANVRQQIITAEKLYHRPTGSVKLLAASKGQSIEKIRAAISAGQTCFGENYLQEALVKMTALKKENLEWHFIGAIQANKTKAIAENFAWVESISRIKIAERLNQQRPAHLPKLNVCIEVNISEEKSKSGIFLADLKELVTAIKQLPRLKLRGLMTIPAAVDKFEQQKLPYKKLQNAWQALQEEGFDLDTLSMGMSNDFEAAIAAGSTLVRIGTAIFGARKEISNHEEPEGKKEK